MALSSSCLWLSHSHLPLKIDNSRQTIGSRQIIPKNKRYSVPFISNNTELFGQQVTGVEGVVRKQWSFLGGSTIVIQPKLARPIAVQKVCRVHASWLIPGLTSSQIANSVFTLGTAAVIPFYTLMVVAPKAKLTRKSMESSIPYVALGLLYTYLLYLSWSPDTLRLMFASKYWLPELPGIAKMFSSEMTLASAWLHLLAVDLYAARQVYHDGLENEIETRHSVSLCLLFCPVGIITHVITKALTRSVKSPSHHT